MKLTIPPIYPITDKKLARCESHLSILKELVRGGATLVQIRDKSTPLQELLRDLNRCVEFASARGVILIVNDRCDLALGCRAAGVHLGQEDLPPDVARAILGRSKWIGLSAHTLAQVQKSQKLPIQYVGFGPIYPTSTKVDAPAIVGLRRLAAACRISKLPTVAIGGIGLEQVREVLQAGACSAAVISALMQAPSIARQMEIFLEKARET
ncbi:MAG TPA: thiamine phosphate synthase [Acidobacteriota bacterium]|nr:thiamine phosphate synthase [Acidobacteriota bacterium]